MKPKVYSFIAGLLLTISVFAQAPQKMTYQAVVRNSSNSLVQNSPIGVKVSILQGSVTGAVVYAETHSTQTNQNGLLNIEIGGGNIFTGIYNNGIFWAGGPYYIKTEIDPLGGANYTITSTSELLSVPYSNYSHVSGSLVGLATSWVGVYELSGIFLYITYLDPNTVLIFSSETEQSGFPYPKPMLGKVNGLSLELKSHGSFQGGQITRNGNTIEITTVDGTLIWTKL